MYGEYLNNNILIEYFTRIREFDKLNFTYKEEAIKSNKITIITPMVIPNIINTINLDIVLPYNEDTSQLEMFLDFLNQDINSDAKIITDGCYNYSVNINSSNNLKTIGLDDNYYFYNIQLVVLIDKIKIKET